MRALAVIRDVVVIVGVITLCALAVATDGSRSRVVREQETRLALSRAAITRLEDAYKKNVFGDSETKGIYQQIFRQNEILLEYQKLLLTLAYVPASSGNTPPAPATP
jgi:hypothetical protein